MELGEVVGDSEDAAPNEYRYPKEAKKSLIYDLLVWNLFVSVSVQLTFIWHSNLLCKLR